MQMTIYSSDNGQVLSPPIDFAFVTALPLVRDAVLQHIDGYEAIHDYSKSLTYYQGYITIPATSECYNIVVIMLTKKASDGIIQMIKRWHPSYMVTIGIADSISEKVRLGDIVAADFVYDHDVIRQILAGKVERIQPFPSDRVLYGRAFSYQFREWHDNITLPWPASSQNDHSSQEFTNRGDITLPWPASSQNGHLSRESTKKGDITLPWPTTPQSDFVTFPKAHFGAIGKSENITMDTKALFQLQAECPTLLAIARDCVGIAQICTQQSYPLSFLEIRGISDYANEQKNIGWHAFAAEAAAEAAAAFTVGLLRSRPIAPLVENIHLGNMDQTNTQKRPLLILCAQSYRHIAEHEIIGALSQDFVESHTIKSIALDLTNLMANGTLTSPATAVQYLTDPQGPLYKALARREKAEFAFHGLIHLPLAFLIGHLVTDLQLVHLFDFHHGPSLETWTWPEQLKPFPPLEVRGVPKRKSVKQRVAVVRISISDTVTPAKTFAVGLHTSLGIDLTLPRPERGLVRSEEQIREYGRTFRQVLDIITQLRPATKCIHVFYAGPVAPAFHLGQQISENINPPVVVWNFRRKFEWGIDLAAALLGKPCIVRPLDPPFPNKKSDEYYRYFGD